MIKESKGFKEDTNKYPREFKEGMNKLLSEQTPWRHAYMAEWNDGDNSRSDKANSAKRRTEESSGWNEDGTEQLNSSNRKLRGKSY